MEDMLRYRFGPVTCINTLKSIMLVVNIVNPTIVTTILIRL